jgi:hypothetical protein
MDFAGAGDSVTPVTVIYSTNANFIDDSSSQTSSTFTGSSSTTVTGTQHISQW